jgi:hypothetical protein
MRKCSAVIGAVPEKTGSLSMIGWGVKYQQTTIEWGDEKHVTRNYGITHTPLYSLRKKGLIRSVSIKPEGSKYGKRLFNIASIEAYLADCERRELATTTEAVAGANQ